MEFTGCPEKEKDIEAMQSSLAYAIIQAREHQWPKKKSYNKLFGKNVKFTEEA